MVEPLRLLLDEGLETELPRLLDDEENELPRLLDDELLTLEEELPRLDDELLNPPPLERELDDEVE